jgi:hypothetical protein
LVKEGQEALLKISFQIRLGMFGPLKKQLLILPNSRIVIKLKISMTLIAMEKSFPKRIKSISS